MQDLLDLVATLTPREREVLVALWRNRGCSARKLAGILCVSEACVRFHLHNIYQKLKVGGKAALLLLCNDFGFGQPAATVRRSRSKRTSDHGFGLDSASREAAQE
ncbi:MAG: helix-turn-helix transcriptional regulator [Firmicutes bacterium]|nr:helix-turn-helix transcriptional regulator [Bacillota bacterium]